MAMSAKVDEPFFYLVYFAGHGVILADTNNPTTQAMLPK
jgi:hypothetical protein